MKITHIALLTALPLLAPWATGEEMDNNPAATGVKTAKPAPIAVPKTVMKAVDDSINFSILKTAIDAAGLREKLSEAKAVTVFAPTDKAFQNLPDGALEELLLPENKEKLRNLLLAHVLAGERTALSLEDGEFTMMSGDKIEIDVDDNGNEISISDSKVVNTDIRTGNGLIHVIDEVVVPESLDGFAGLDD